MPQSIPQVAQVEDYNSDESSVKPGTRKEARKRPPAPPPPPKALSRYKSAHADGASDSGYSSRTSGTHASNVSANVQTAGPVQPPPRPATSHGQIKAKPLVSQPTRPRAPSRSASTSRRSSDQCNDLNCRHSICLAVRYPERRSSITQQQTPQYAPQYAASPGGYQQVPQYQYAQVSQSQSSQTVPTLSSFPQPRLRSGSTSRQARPMSIHGYPFQPPSGTSTPGPPPSASAYQNMDYQTMDPKWAQWCQQAMLLRQQQAYQLQQQQQAQQQAAYAAAANQSQAYTMQTQPSPLQTSPTSPKFGRSARLQQAYSARVTTPMSASGTSTPNYFPSGLTRTPSTRQMSAREYKVPGEFPGDGTSSSETDSSSEDSSSDISEEEYERERRARARDSRLMSSSSQRRPSMSKQYRTEPVVPTTNRLAREMLTRNPRSDHVLEYVSSDNMDSDRTTRAIVDRPRTTYTDSTRSSRRPSLSTTASSGRTRATTMSSATSGMASMTLESRSGRRISYLSERDQAKYARKQEEERRRIEKIEAYQDSISGGKVPELTAEKLKMSQKHSSSHGYAPSRKSSRASSRAAYNPSDGVKIENGGTTIHVYGNQSIEMIPSRDGGTASLVIGSRSGRDSAYFGDSSKSSGSRAGKSRVGSDVGARREQVIQEEYGAEQAAI